MVVPGLSCAIFSKAIKTFNSTESERNIKFPYNIIPMLLGQHDAREWGCITYGLHTIMCSVVMQRCKNLPLCNPWLAAGLRKGDSTLARHFLYWHNNNTPQHKNCSIEWKWYSTCTMDTTRRGKVVVFCVC